MQSDTFISNVELRSRLPYHLTPLCLNSLAAEVSLRLLNSSLDKIEF